MQSKNAFKLAIIGRPNVGKSSLYNRLTRTNFALVQDTPGVTRDWREGSAELIDLSFQVLDTAGLENAKSGTLAARMTEQTLAALKHAHAALLVVDGQTGLLPDDRVFAQLVRKSGKPVLLAVNKTESERTSAALEEALRLGFGEPIRLSAVHGLGLDDLYHRLAAVMRETGHYQPIADEEKPKRRRGKDKDFDADAPGTEEDEDELHPVQMVILGRPNAGKSTLMNHLLKEERVLTGPEAGITRDAIAASWQWRGRPFTLVDTAGLRKRRKVEEELEKMAGADTLRALKYANVAVLMMDARESFEKQDLALANLVAKEGRALVVCVNKWDLVPQNMRVKYLKEAQAQLDAVLPEVRGVPLVPMSAQTGEGVEDVLRAVVRMVKLWNKRVPTAQLNRWLEDALATHAPPMVNGRRMKIRYATQIKTRPPTFALFGNYPAEPPAAYMRYLLHSLREHTGLQGIPVRLLPRKPKNPYKKEDR